MKLQAPGLRIPGDKNGPHAVYLSMTAEIQALEVLPGVPEIAEDGGGSRLLDRLRGLFSDLARGERRALEPLYDLCSEELYGLALWRVGCAADAAEIVQEIWVRLATTEADLVAVRDPRAYLLAMTHRAAVDSFRRRRRETRLDDLVETLSAPDPGLAARIDAGRASRLIYRLPGAQREAVYLRWHAGLSFAEIGRVTGVPTFTAASRVRLGLARLRRWMRIER